MSPNGTPQATGSGAAKLIWTVLFIAGGLFLLYRAFIGDGGMGKVYVRDDVIEYVRVRIDLPYDSRLEEPELRWVQTDSAEAAEYERIGDDVHRRISRRKVSPKAYAYANGRYLPENLSGEQMQEVARMQNMDVAELTQEKRELQKELADGLPLSVKKELGFVGTERAADQDSELLSSSSQVRDRLSRFVHFSPMRTIGVWIAAFFTLCIFSFLYRDNVFYKLAESVVVGVSAAYWMVVGFWTTIVQNLFGKLFPAVVREWGAQPAMDREAGWIDLHHWYYFIPLILGVMLLWRLAPRGAWISRWPLAFIIGTTAGIRLVGFLEADFLSQIRNAIEPLIVLPGQVYSGTTYETWADALDQSAKNILLFVGVLSGLLYFFFSVEHQGVAGKVSKVGIWFLMITFGAGFGYTVMGRIALLAIRLEFLFDEWLWLVDPTQARPPGM